MTRRAEGTSGIHQRPPAGRVSRNTSYSCPSKEDIKESVYLTTLRNPFLPSTLHLCASQPGQGLRNTHAIGPHFLPFGIGTLYCPYMLPCTVIVSYQGQSMQQQDGVWKRLLGMRVCVAQERSCVWYAITAFFFFWSTSSEKGRKSRDMNWQLLNGE